MEDNFPLYITFKTTNDYEHGAIFEFTMTSTSKFEWQGPCTALSKNCSDEEGCTTVHPLKDGEGNDYTCKNDKDKVTFTRFRNSSNLAVSSNETMRIKMRVKTPNYVTDSLNGVRLVVRSRYADYMYEEKDENNLFKTVVIKMKQSSIVYLWGLTGTSAEN